MRREREGSVVFDGGSWVASGKRRLSLVFFALLAALFASALFAAPAWAQDLTIVKNDSPDPVRVGQNLTYTIQVTNPTSSPLPVTVTDTLPNRVALVDLSAGCQQIGSRTVTCNIGPIQVGGTGTAQIIVRPRSEGTITNTAQITSPAGNFSTATARTNVRDNNNNKGKNNKGKNNNKGKGKGRGFAAIDQYIDQYDEEDFDEDGDVDQDDELFEAENDLDGEEFTDGEITNGDDFDGDPDGDDGPVSATSGDGQAEASTPGAVARSGDPDEFAPETSTQGDVVDEVPTSGPLPNTGGVPVAAGTVAALVLFGGGLLAARLVMIWRGRRA